MSADSKKLSRRVIVRGGVALGLSVVGSSALLGGCGGDDAPNCMSPPGITADERAKRGQFNYKEQSPDPARKCSACTFFTAAQAPEVCGPCTLGLGAVHPDGTCDSFAPRA